MLLAVCLFCLGISCVRGRLQLEVAKQVPPDASGPICGGCRTIVWLVFQGLYLCLQQSQYP